MPRNDLNKAIADDFREAAYRSIREFIPVVEQDLKDIMEEVADDFYNDYRPGTAGERNRNDWRAKASRRQKDRVYPQSYHRQYSLYDILDVQTDESAMTISWDFDPSPMEYRSGYNGEDGLYDLVFREGWHGGAQSGPRHPGNGAAWRHPNPFFTEWFDDPAERAETTPLDNWKQQLSNYENRVVAEKFKELLTANLRDKFR